MSATIRDLSVLCYAQGFTLWHYKTRDAFAQVRAPGYFADPAVRDLFAAGDMLLVSASGAGALLLVSEVAPAVILLPLSATDATPAGRIAA